MKIDFNNVRKQALRSYSCLVNELNISTDGSAVGNMVRVPADSIKDHLDDLRSALVGIACTYEPDNSDFQCVLGEDQHIPLFNEADE
jgi:hypothetical protein